MGGSAISVALAAGKDGLTKMKRRLPVFIALIFAALVIGGYEPALARYSKCIPKAGEDARLTQEILKSMSSELRKKKLVYSDPGFNCNQLYSVYLANGDGSGQTRIIPDLSSALFPAWSPDGTKMVVNRYFSDIYIVNADGANPKKVISIELSQGMLYSPIWSPDGKQIAFTGNIGGAKTGTFIINIDGTHQFELLNSSELYTNVLSWSPDSSQIVYTEKTAKGEYEIYLMRGDGSERAKLADGSQPDWSPDGKQIAFAASQWALSESNVPQLHSAITVIAPDGSGLRELFVSKSDQYVYAPVWSPKGTYIAFAVSPLTSKYLFGNRDIYIIGADGSNPMSINENQLKVTSRLQNVGGPSWSFDEQFIIYDLSRDDNFQGTTDVGLTELSTGKSTVLLQMAESASWQP
jgi:Tol biopolymer transport system component